MIDGHGNDIYLYGNGEIKIDFSSNIAFNNQSDNIVEYLSQNLNSIKNYPDPSVKTLTSMIADREGVGDNEVLVVNGSAEAFYLVAHYLSLQSTTRTAIFTPSFAEYEDSCTLYKHTIDYYSIAEVDKVDYSLYRSVWLGVPNNPNGVRVKSSVISDLAAKHNECCFVLDMAYDTLSAYRDDKIELSDNMIKINSLTKSFGIPGLRLGYIVSNSSVIDQLRGMRPPWSVNAPAIVVGEYVMTYYDDLIADRDILLVESKYLQEQIKAIEGFRVVESECNFFLCEILSNSDVNQLKRYLAKEHGILIRDCSNFRGLTNRYFRVAAQSRNKNLELIKALKLWS